MLKEENYKVIEINSCDCFEILKTHSQSHLIDVRTKPEWEFVGVPDLACINKQTFFISWRLYPDMRINYDFEREILQLKINQEDLVFSICRSGQRSQEAAAHLNKLGYRNCYNISDGFEGYKDSSGHRALVNGWKYNSLPWKQ